jgi:hypothetical protein
MEFQKPSLAFFGGGVFAPIGCSKSSTADSGQCECSNHDDARLNKHSEKKQGEPSLRSNHSTSDVAKNLSSQITPCLTQFRSRKLPL